MGNEKFANGGLTWLLPFCLFAFLLLFSCSESDDEGTENEYANWQARNDAFFATLEDSLRGNTESWQKWKSFTKNAQTVGVSTDYVYAKYLTKADEVESPLYTDTVRVAYRGRLIPSVSYPQGYVFDQTYVGSYDIRTTDVLDGAVSGFTVGFSTALQHMHKGDRCLLYVPYQLGYGISAYNSVPGYSVLIFDVVLLDYASGSESLVQWSTRRFANE